MNSFPLYRPRYRWRTWVAFTCAAAIHVAAIGLAKNKSEPIAPDIASPGEVTGIDTVIDESPPPEPDTSTPTLVPANDEEIFREESASPPPIRKKRVAAPVARSASGVPHLGSVRALVLFGPRPDYPYVARRDRITGSGIALATVVPATGSVLDVHMAQSTGNMILDNSTVSALRRWRFRPGTLSRVQVPITYTLSGASY
jgi:periplasmic protein TonB